jgi:hypothetical protein
VFLALCIVALFIFAFLTYRARRILDSRMYLAEYTKHVEINKIRQYLKAIYVDASMLQTSRKKALPWQQKTIFLSDPFQPIREYIKDSALKSYDGGTANGLRFFSELFDRVLESVKRNPKPDEFYYLARYITENTHELFVLFEKTSSEKRKMDIIRLLFEKGGKLLEAADDDGLLTIIRGLEDIARTADDDDEIMIAIGYIRSLCDAYLAGHKRAKWSEVATVFEESCLSVTRISETYYLQKDNPLKTVPIIGNVSGGHRSVTVVLVDFFTAYKDLADRYIDAYPQYYFEAIEAVVEALFVRLGDIVAGGRTTMGRNNVYHELAESLYSIYDTFGIDAIEHKKPELLALSIGNLRRVIRPAKNLGLASERTRITAMLVGLADEGIKTFGDIKLKGERTISMYAKETLDKHGKKEDIVEALEQNEADKKLADLLLDK